MPATCASSCGRPFRSSSRTRPRRHGSRCTTWPWAREPCGSSATRSTGACSGSIDGREILGTTELPFAPRSIAAGEGAVWVTGSVDDVVARLDPASGSRLQTIDVGRGASGVAVGSGAVWVASALAREVSRIDPVSGETVARIPIDGAPREVAVGAGGVWVTADAG